MADSEVEAGFSRAERLRRHEQFAVVQRRGQRLAATHLIAFVYRSGEGRRLGITVSKRVGNAVVRNRVKRLVREAWRRRKQQLPPGYDVVLIGRASAAGATLAAIDDDIARVVLALQGWEQRRGARAPGGPSSR